jgi:hypothetical protein
MPGWQLVQRDPSAAYWRDAAGDVISLTLAPIDRSFPLPSKDHELQHYCRQIAERQAAGLLEVSSHIGPATSSITYLYKRLKVPALTFHGVIVTRFATGTWMWMMIAAERGVTGLREASVVERLLASGQLALETFESSWARDPYDSSYQGVDRSTLRNSSDAEEYDTLFPDHPLSKVRRELRRLLGIDLTPGIAA